MKQFVKEVISQYNSYTSEVQLYQKNLLYCDDALTKAQLSLLEMRVAVIDAWLNLLNADERFVVQKHIMEELDWPRISFVYSEEWNHEFIRTERSLQNYQNSAIAKIAAFVDRHKDMVLPLFSDITTETVKM